MNMWNLIAGFVLQTLCYSFVGIINFLVINTKVNYQSFPRFPSNPEQSTSLKSANSCQVSEKRADTVYVS